VLRYWTDFIPSWAGAISIDLLPVVLVLVLMIAYDAMRKETAGVDEADSMTAGELLRAMDLYRQLSGKPLVEEPVVAVPGEASPPEEEPPATVVVAAVEPEKPAASPPAPSGNDATVTALDVTRKRP